MRAMKNRPAFTEPSCSAEYSRTAHLARPYLFLRAAHPTATSRPPLAVVERMIGRTRRGLIGVLTALAFLGASASDPGSSWVDDYNIGEIPTVWIWSDGLVRFAVHSDKVGTNAAISL